MCEIPAKTAKKQERRRAVTKSSGKEVRRALRQYDGRGKWAAVLDR